MIFTSENPIQNEKSFAKSSPLSIEILEILPKILHPIRAENENPSTQKKIAVRMVSVGANYLQRFPCFFDLCCYAEPPSQLKKK